LCAAWSPDGDRFAVGQETTAKTDSTLFDNLWMTSKNLRLAKGGYFDGDETPYFTYFTGTRIDTFIDTGISMRLNPAHQSPRRRSHPENVSAPVYSESGSACFPFFPLVCFPMCMVRDVDEILVWPLPRPFFQGYSPLLLARGGHTENLQVAAEMRSLCGGLKMCLASVVPDFGKACARNMDNYESKYISYALHLHIIANRGKFRSQASEKMDRWKSRGGKSQRREETN